MHTLTLPSLIFISSGLSLALTLNHLVEALSRATFRLWRHVGLHVLLLELSVVHCIVSR